MNFNTYIGLDPSLAAFGISIIDNKNKKIVLDQFKADDHHNFIFMSWSISNLYNAIYNKYKEYLYNANSYIGQEAPIASGINSGKLNALGYAFYSNLGLQSGYERIRTYHPIKLKVFHHTKKYDKKLTIKVIEDILDIFKTNGYDIDIRYSRTKKSINITDGEADSMMYCVKQYLDNEDNEITKAIINKYPNFSKIISNEELINNG